MFVTVNAYDICMVIFLVFLEGILSLDNALVLALAVKHLSPPQRKKALSYGIASAFIFRFIALFFLSQLMKIIWLKIVGAVYLLTIGLNHFLLPSAVDQERKFCESGFFRTVLVVETLDLIFSMDSIFAAVGVSNNVFLIFIGGALGIIMMRFAANFFVTLIERFNKLEGLAYGIVIAIGVKLGFQAFMALP